MGFYLTKYLNKTKHLCYLGFQYLFDKEGSDEVDLKYFDLLYSLSSITMSTAISELKLWKLKLNRLNEKP